MTRSSLRGAIMALALVGASEARAEDSASRLHLTYEAPSGCPSRRDFLVSLSPRIQESWVDGSDTRSFDVRVVREAKAFVGHLVIRQPGREPNLREIRSGACKAVTAALVVFVAIALDPASESDATEPSVEAPSAETAAPQPLALPETEPPVAPPPPRRRTQRRSPPNPPPPIVSWTWSAGVALAHLRATEPAWGARVHAELARARERDRFAPAIRLSWGWSDFITAPEQAGEVRFRLKSARIEAGARTPLRPALVGAVLGGDVGSLPRNAPDPPPFSKVSAPWAAWSGAVRTGVNVAPWLAVELAATLLVPFERPRFDLRDPPRVAYAAPAVLFEGSAGVVAVARFR